MTYFLKMISIMGIVAVVMLGSFVIVPISAQAQTGSISGDEVCGGPTTPKCTLTDGKRIMKAFVTTLVIPIGLTLLTVFIIFRVLMAQKALMEGNTNAYKEATKKIGNAVFSFVVVVAVIGGLAVAMLKYLGVKDAFTFLLSYETYTPAIQTVVHAFIPTAYAQSGYLENPVGVNNLYDFILIIVRLVVRWFIYPAIIAMWVWTGFSFVAAQGRPEQLAKAKKWLLWGIIATVVIALTEGFLFAVRGTVNEILPSAAAMIDHGRVVISMIQK